MASKCKKSKIWPYRPWQMTFRAIQPNLSFDMWFMSPQRSSMPKKKKSYWSVSEIDPSPLNLDGQTDRRTDGRTTDKSVLEKLRCLSAGGAKKWTDNGGFDLYIIYLIELHQNLIDWPLWVYQQSHQISCKSAQYFLSFLANTQTGQKQYLPPGGRGDKKID